MTSIWPSSSSSMNTLPRPAAEAPSCYRTAADLYDPVFVFRSFRRSSSSKDEDRRGGGETGTTTANLPSRIMRILSLRQLMYARSRSSLVTCRFCGLYVVHFCPRREEEATLIAECQLPSRRQHPMRFPGGSSFLIFA